MARTDKLSRRSRAPRFDGLRPGSEASAKAKRRTPSVGTRPEIALRKALWKEGLRYRVNFGGLVGRPDIVFLRERVAVFCDGDFFHGRDWPELQKKLRGRANPDYWVRKIEYNRDRDVEVNQALQESGWRVLRYWESDIAEDTIRIVSEVNEVLMKARG